MPILYFRDGEVAGDFSEHALKCHNLKAGDEVREKDIAKICDSHFQFDTESDEYYKKDRFQQYECGNCENMKYHDGSPHCSRFTEKPKGECPQYHE